DLPAGPVTGAAVVPDLLGAGRAEALARALAPLRDATPGTTGDGIPDHVRLVELLAEHTGVDAVDPASLIAGWRRSGRSARALLGVGRDGPVTPDLRHDGPHVLVAGTTGAGKSELLQTLIASLAVANRPDELTFLLVDYKGGAAFADCARLPHTVGLVTDLDEHLTRRALASLTAEIRRRERLLAAAGAADLQAYQASAPVEPLPRLVIVVDEFRVLAEELPDFVSGLVRLAAVGRSLGLHLVLATQRPAGVVGADIAANVNLRIALRVRDRADSTDVVEAPDAAAIDPRRPGRAVARTGSGPLLEFQTARVSGQPPATRTRREPTVRREPWLPPAHGPEREAAPAAATTGTTDLALVVEALAEAAQRCGVRPPRRPWVPPLPERLDRRAVTDAGGPPADDHLALGLRDEPAQQRQRPAVLRLRPGTALAVVGTTRSGRSGVLAAVAAAAAEHAPSRVHLYALASSTAVLAGLDRLPHTGAVVGRDEPERMTRLLRRLAAEVEARRAAPPDVVATAPAVVLLVDGWEAVQQALEDAEHAAGMEHLLRVVREGPAVAVSTVVTGDRTLLTGRVAAALGERLLLRVADPTDAVLAGV
ncbi:MAG: FtsK/SpoIIIE domain-containing protein, partial [Actinomycetota bacterium]